MKILKIALLLYHLFFPIIVKRAGENVLLLKIKKFLPTGYSTQPATAEKRENMAVLPNPSLVRDNKY